MVEITNKKWSKEEVEYLESAWGTVAIPSIAKKLDRSLQAVKLKANKIGLTAFLECGDYITLNLLRTALRNGNANGGNYTIDQWERKGLPIRRKRVDQCSFKVVKVEDFWRWAEKNRTLIDFSKMEPGALGAEPGWAKEQRKADNDMAKFKRTPWTVEDDGILKSMLRQYRYGYRELSERLNRTEGAIKRRIMDLGLRERPLKAYNHNKWTEEEVEILSEMYEKGYQPDAIRGKINRSAQSIRGKIERMVYGGQLRPRSNFRKTC
ncbi:hypothetical protein EUAN_08850 [Andreesenia angusta]|uniref:Myb-like domain-containing protein n=1 Tax=Andreesenia angusta TaxID=39480 RepID=A0A1S1V908_9FIRM|nr:hypothetical protein [Andreesenia angusta]OHW63101.1 hypothetical protein EUAN_08850 [Andreesenia angusta]